MIGRIREDLCALFGPIGRPGISVFVCWGCAALAYPLSSKGGYTGVVGAAVVLFLSVLVLAYLLGSAATAFFVDAKRLCLPGSRRFARRADILASALLLPPIVLTVVALAGNPVWPAWVAPVLALATAVAGFLAPRRPVFAAGLLLLVVLAAYWAANARGVHGRGEEWAIALGAVAIVLLAAAVPLLAAVEWHRMIARGSRAASLAERIRTLCTRIDQGGALKRAPGMARSAGDAGVRQSPVQIVRTCLGGTFVRPSRRLIIGAALLAVFIVAATGISWLGERAGRWTVTILALVAGGLLASGFLTQISKLTREQMAELALIPGLGLPAAQRRALCRAVLAPPLLWLAVVLLLGSADLLLIRDPLPSIGMLAACLLILWISYAVFALHKLANLPAKRQSFIAEFLLLYLAVYASGSYYWVYATQPQVRLWFWFWSTPVLFSFAIAAAIGFSIRRLASAPHPFLT